MFFDPKLSSDSTLPPSGSDAPTESPSAESTEAKRNRKRSSGKGTTEGHSSLLLAFHGVHVRVSSSSNVLLEAIAADFRFFVRSSSPVVAQIEVLAFNEPCKVANLPEVTTSDISERCVRYQSPEGRLLVYYGGEAIALWKGLDLSWRSAWRALWMPSTKREAYSIWSTDGELLHELVYLFILSRVGEILDYRGIHRLHAAALSYNHQAVLVAMPSGGGKTTLCLSAMEQTHLRWLSDDIPLVDRRGDVLAFPTRIGVSEMPQATIPRACVRVFIRKEHSPKWLVDLDAFPGRLAARAVPGLLIVGVRKLKGDSRLVSVSKMRALPELFRGMVVGVGLPQLVEYFVRFEFREIFFKAWIVFSRVYAMTRLLMRSKVMRFEIGPDRQMNIDLLLEAIERELDAKQKVKGRTVPILVSPPRPSE